MTVHRRFTGPANAVSRATAVLMVVIGMSVFIVQPGFVQGIVDHGGFTAMQAGHIAAAEMFGIAFSTILMTVLMTRCNWRVVASVSLAAVIVANVLAAGISGFTEFAALRFLVGTGGGALISVGYATVGLGDNPDRDFGYLIMWVLVYSALMLLAMPAAFSLVGVAGVIGSFAVLALAGVPFVHLLPTGGRTQEPRLAVPEKLPVVGKLMALAGLHSYFLAQGVVWAYLALIGTAAGISAQDVAIGLTVSQILGIAGALTAALISIRLGRASSLVAGVLAGIVALGCLAGPMNALAYGAAVGVFNYAANFVTPLLMAIIAAIDRTGRMIVQAVALQMLGLAIGPALAASIIAPDDFHNAIWISMGLFAACLALSLPPLRSAPDKAG